MLQDIEEQTSDSLLSDLVWIDNELSGMSSYMNREYYDLECYYEIIEKELIDRGLTSEEINAKVDLGRYMKELTK